MMISRCRHDSDFWGESESPHRLHSHFKDLFVLAVLGRQLRTDRAMIGP